MKKYLCRKGTLVLLFIAMTVSVSAQIYVKIRPTFHVTERPVRPSPNHVWIEEDWDGRGNEYQYTGGRWANPPHEGYIWAPGRWEHHGHKGDKWNPGRWKKH